MWEQPRPPGGSDWETNVLTAAVPAGVTGQAELSPRAVSPHSTLENSGQAMAQMWAESNSSIFVCWGVTMGQGLRAPPLLPKISFRLTPEAMGGFTPP